MTTNRGQRWPSPNVSVTQRHKRPRENPAGKAANFVGSFSRASDLGQWDRVGTTLRDHATDGDTLCWLQMVTPGRIVAPGHITLRGGWR